MQAARAVAAWMVVAGHAWNVGLGISGLGAKLGFLTPLFGALAHWGVDMFFVISGTIMYVLYGRRDAPTGLAAGVDFVRKRSLRIYPLFWVTSLAGVFLLLAPTLPQLPDQHIIWQILLIDIPLFNLVAWTLSYEIHFYFWVLLVILFSWKRPDIGMIVLVPAMLVAWMLKPFRHWPLWTSDLMWQFALGLVVGVAFRHLRMGGVPAVVLGVTGTLAGVWFLPADHQEMLNARFLQLAVPAALLLYGVMTLEREGRIRVPALLSAAGDRSYSVYLWHFPLLFAPVARFLPAGPGGAAVWAVGQLAVLLLVSEASYRLLERPLMSLARKPGLPRPGALLPGRT